MMQDRLQAIVVLGFHVGISSNARSNSSLLKSLARDSMYSRLASRLASTRTRTLQRRRGPWLQAQRRVCTNPRVRRYSCSYPLSFYCPQKIARCQDPYSKPLDAHEMPDVMGDDGVRPARYGEFENEFVAGVRENGRSRK